MPMPRSVVRVRRNGITYVSNVDRAQYTLRELSRAALKDIAKLIRKRTIQKLQTLPGLKRSKRPYKAVGYWVRKNEDDLQIGFGNSKKGTSGDTWYAIQAELGSKNQPKRGFLRSTVYENIGEIRIIAGKYIKEIENENRAMGLIDESEDVGDDAGN